MTTAAAIQTTERIVLPTGGFWDLRVRPTMRDAMAMQGLADGAEAMAGMLATLTPAWSFPEPVTAETVLDRDVEDVAEVVEVFTRRVMPFLVRFAEKQNRRASLSP